MQKNKGCLSGILYITKPLNDCKSLKLLLCASLIQSTWQSALVWLTGPSLEPSPVWTRPSYDFDWVLSAMAFQEPNSKSSLLQNRYPYHCPTHELSSENDHWHNDTTRSEWKQNNELFSCHMHAETVRGDGWNPRCCNTRRSSDLTLAVGVPGCVKLHLHHCGRLHVKQRRVWGS